MYFQSLILLLTSTLASTNRIGLNTTLLELVSRKNAENRYNLKFDKISNRFSPEDPSYYEGLFIEGLWAIGLSILIILLLLGISYIKFRYGYFGGKKLKNTEFTTYVRWTPGLIFSVSFILFFISGISLLIESSKITDKAENLEKLAVDNSRLLFNDIDNTYQYLISLNMQHIDDGLYVTINNLDLALEESKNNVKKAKNFKNDIKLLNNRRAVVTIVSFCLGIIFFGLGVLSFILKIESLGYALAISMGVMASLEILVAIPYVMERVASTDMCEQIIECNVDNSLPVDGYELGYYFSDFSKLTKDHLGVSLQDLNSQLNIAKSQVNSIQNTNSNAFGGQAIKNII